MTTKYLIQDVETRCYFVSANTWAEAQSQAFECDTLMDALNLVDQIAREIVLVIVNDELHTMLSESGPYIDLYADGNHA